MVLTLTLNQAQAQSNSEYNFNQFRLEDGAQHVDYADPLVKDTVTKFDLLCLAANGHGQWTATANDIEITPKTTAGWYLLGNSLVQPSFWHVSRGMLPSSVMAKGPFDTETHPSEILVTANLDGRVRYVWPSTDRASFKIQGLNDQGSTDENLIDIDLTDYPNPPTSRVLTKHTAAGKSIYAYTDVSTSINPLTSSESNYRDRFDIASDKKFLYIVWRCDIGGSKIFAMAVELSTGTVSLTATQVDNGVRPTVACDVRNNPSTPEFDVVYLDQVGGAVKHKTFSSSAFTTHAITRSFIHPNFGTNNTYDARHARVVVSSVEGGAPTKAIYVIVREDGNGANQNHLVMHHNVHTGSAKYVDGNLIGPPANSPSFTPNLYVKDAPIQAFANPYDNQTNATNHQLHCVYQLMHTSGGNSVDPLVIVRSYDQATRLILSTTSGALHQSISAYVAAVNQMGVHVHWRGTQTVSGSPVVSHFYARDMTRTFDEPIEENTLVTNTCKISDGTAHGGLAGARVNQGRNVTIWSNMNYGVVSGTSPNQNIETIQDHRLGGLEQPHVGALQFDGENITFAVGQASATGSPSTLTMSGVSRFDITIASTTQTIEIHPNATWHFYSLMGVQTWNFGSPYSVFPKIKLLGLAEQTLPPTLHLHAGSTFILQHKSQLDATKAKMISSYEAPQTTIRFTAGAAVYPSKPAFFELAAKTTLTESEIEGNNPFLIERDFLIIEPCQQFACSDASPANQFTATDCAFTNTYTDPTTSIAGHSLILFKQLSSATWETSIFDGCTFDDITIKVDNPLNPFKVLNSSFTNIAEEGGIYLTRNLTTGLAYEQILIDNNEFGIFRTGAPGISVENFDRTNALTALQVSDNTFTANASTVANFRVPAAVKFVNSSGGILNNTVTDDNYAIGIINESTNLTGPVTNSLICSNVIENANTVDGSGNPTFLGAGIKTSWHDGYSKLNDVFTSDRGHISGTSDLSHIIFSDYNDNSGPGVETIDASSIVDMTGVHHPDTTDDYPANNNVLRNGASQSHTQLLLIQGSLILLGKDVSTWTEYGYNNIVKNSTDVTLIKANATTALGDLSRNHWGNAGIDPALGAGASPGDWKANGIVEQHSLNVTGYTSTEFKPALYTTTDPVCSGGFTFAKEKLHPGVVQAPLVEMNCHDHLATGRNLVSNGYNQEGLDTLKSYIEKCYAETESWRAFGTSMKGAVQRLGEADENIHRRHRDWLLKVLYYNPDTMYYCGDVDAIIQTFAKNGDRGYDVNAMISIVKFLVEENRCPHLNEWFASAWLATRGEQSRTYQDTITNRELYPLDTSLLTLEELDLGLLRGPQAAAPIESLGGNKGLLSFTASINPFKTGTILNFSLASKELVSLTIHTVLGEEVFTTGVGRLYEIGDHQIPITVQDLPSGTLYARLTTLDGEVRTVKLIKQ